jgi:peptidoglycan/LPS O-acetylase OafA/YrhL
MLASYSLYGKLQKGQKINSFKETLIRYLRLFPPLVSLIIFCTFILPKIGTGPLYPMLINEQSEMCKKTYWRNILMIHNWFGFENVCMSHTHHVGIDFQLFISAPLLVMMLYKFPVKSSIGIIILSILSTIGRFYVIYTRRLSSYILHNSK